MPLVIEAFTTKSESVPCASNRTLPVPSALTAVLVVSATSPGFSVMLPALVTSTMLPPLPVIRSLWLLVCAATAAALSTRCTITVTVSTVTPSVSVTYTPPDPADAERVATVVSRWLVLVPMAPLEPALMNKPADVTSTSASETASPSRMLTLAIRRTSPLTPPVVMVSKVMVPLVATRLMSPPLLVMVRVSAPTSCDMRICRPAR